MMPTLPAYAQYLEVENRRLLAVLKEIAEMRYCNTSAATIAQNAIEKTGTGGKPD